MESYEYRKFNPHGASGYAIKVRGYPLKSMSTLAGGPPIKTQTGTPVNNSQTTTVPPAQTGTPVNNSQTGTPVNNSQTGTPVNNSQSTTVPRPQLRTAEIASGNPLFGNSNVPVEVTGTTGTNSAGMAVTQRLSDVFQPAYDASGKPILDSTGNPVMIDVGTGVRGAAYKRKSKYTPLTNPAAFKK
jgi:hypothetical protein